MSGTPYITGSGASQNKQGQWGIFNKLLPLYTINKQGADPVVKNEWLTLVDKKGNLLVGNVVFLHKNDESAARYIEWDVTIDGANYTGSVSANSYAADNSATYVLFMTATKMDASADTPVRGLATVVENPIATLIAVPLESMFNSNRLPCNSIVIKLRYASDLMTNNIFKAYADIAEV